VVTDYGTALVTIVPDQGLPHPDCVRIERQRDRLVSFTRATCTVTTEKGRPIPWSSDSRRAGGRSAGGSSTPAAINMIMDMYAVLESAS
jgi:hypothetical protein